MDQNCNLNCVTIVPVHMPALVEQPDFYLVPEKVKHHMSSYELIQ